jgi:hypothetical protein
VEILAVAVALVVIVLLSLVNPLVVVHPQKPPLL